MNGKRWYDRLRLLLFALALTLLAGMAKPANAQDIEDITDVFYEGEVECTSAILDSTDQNEIDTYSDTWEDYFGEISYGTYEEAYLYDNNNGIDQTWAVDDGEGDSYAEMSDPVTLGDTYLLVTNHYLWDEGSCEDPSDDFDECDVISIANTSVSVIAGAPYLTTIDPNSAQVGTSPAIDVYGDNLIDPFTFDIDPQISGSGFTLDSAYGYTSPVTVNYSIALGASTGNQALTLSNRFGTSNGVNFYVYDPPPYISNINPSTWQAGATNFPVTINGSGFGSNPTVSVYPNASCTVTGASDNGTSAQITCNCSVAGGDNSPNAIVTVTSNGYNGLGYTQPPQGQPNSASNSVNVNSGQGSQLPTPQIFYFGGPTIPSSVYVGQEIALTTYVPALPAGDTKTSDDWTIGGTAIGGYTATNSGGQVTPLGALSGPSVPEVTFYWTTTGGQQQASYNVTYRYCVNNSATLCASTTATFSVGGPTGAGINVATDSVHIWPSYIVGDTNPLLQIGKALPGSAEGIVFTVPNSTTLPTQNQGAYT